MKASRFATFVTRCSPAKAGVQLGARIWASAFAREQGKGTSRPNIPGRNPSDQPQSADAAVGDDVQPHEPDRAEIAYSLTKDMNLVGLQLLLAKQQRPALRLRADLLGTSLDRRRRL